MNTTNGSSRPSTTGVPNFEDRYQVTPCGTIVVVSGRYAGRTLAWEKTRKGYARVELWKDGMRHRFYVHQLVASVFLPNPDSKPFVHHRDFNKLNNRADNLEWCTYAENMAYNVEEYGF